MSGTGSRTIQVTIGAALGSGFRSTFGAASASARQFGGAVKALDMQARQVAGLERQERAVNAAQLAWKRAEAQVKALTQSFAGATTPTRQQTAELGRAEGAARKAETRLKGLNAALAAPAPVSPQRAQALGRLEAAAASARAKIDALNRAMAAPVAPTTRQVESLTRVQVSATAAAEKVRLLEAALARAGATGPTERQTAAMEKARARAEALEGQARSLAAALTANRAPTEAQTAALARAEAQAAKLTQRVEALRSGMASAAQPTERQTAALERAKGAYAAAAGKVDALRTAMAAATGPNREQAKELDRAATAARNAKGAYEAQAQALERNRRAAQGVGLDTRNLAGETTRLGAAYQQATARLNEFNAAQAHRERAGDLARQMAGQGLAVAGFARSMSPAIRTAADFEHGLARFGTVADASGEGVAALRRQLLDMSAAARTNQAAPALLGGLQDLVGKGMPEAEAVASIETIGRAATATGASIEDLANTSFSAWQNMRIAPSELGRALDSMAQSAKDGGFEVKNMARFFPALTARAQQFKLTGQSGIASIGAMLQVALRTAGTPDEAANNIQNFIDALGSEETQNNFRKAGVDLTAALNDAMATGVNPLERVVAITKRLAGDDPLKLATLFHDRQARQGILALIQNTDDYIRIRDRAFNARGVIGRDYATMMETFREKTGAASIAVSNLGEATGRALLPVLTPLVAGFTHAVEGATALIERFPRLSATVIGAAGGFVLLRTAVTGLRLAGAVLGFSRLGSAAAAGAGGTSLLGRAVGFLGTHALPLAATGLRVLGAALVANPIGATVAAIAAGGLLLYQNWEPIKGLFSGLGDVLAGAGRALGVWGTTLAGVVGSACRTVSDFLGIDPVAVAGARWTAFSSFMGDIWSGIRGIAGGAIDWIGGKLEGLGNALAAISDRLGATLREAREAWDRLVGTSAPAPLPTQGAPTAADRDGQGLAARVEERNRQAGRRAGAQRINDPEWAAETPQAAPSARTDFARVAPPVELDPPPLPARPRSLIEQAWAEQDAARAAGRPGRIASDSSGVQADPPPPRTAPPQVGATQQVAAPASTLLPPVAGPPGASGLPRAPVAAPAAPAAPPATAAPLRPTPPVSAALPPAPQPIPARLPPQTVPLVPPEAGAAVGALDGLTRSAAECGAAVREVSAALAQLADRTRAVSAPPAGPDLGAMLRATPPGATPAAAPAVALPASAAPAPPAATILPVIHVHVAPPAPSAAAFTVLPAPVAFVPQVAPAVAPIPGAAIAPAETASATATPAVSQPAQPASQSAQAAASPAPALVPLPSPAPVAQLGPVALPPITLPAPVSLPAPVLLPLAAPPAAALGLSGEPGAAGLPGEPAAALPPAPLPKPAPLAAPAPPRLTILPPPASAAAPVAPRPALGEATADFTRQASPAAPSPAMAAALAASPPRQAAAPAPVTPGAAIAPMLVAPPPAPLADVPQPHRRDQSERPAGGPEKRQRAPYVTGEAASDYPQYWGARTGWTGGEASAPETAGPPAPWLARPVAPGPALRPVPAPVPRSAAYPPNAIAFRQPGAPGATMDANPVTGRTASPAMAAALGQAPAAPAEPAPVGVTQPAAPSVSAPSGTVIPFRRPAAYPANAIAFRPLGSATASPQGTPGATGARAPAARRPATVLNGPGTPGRLGAVQLPTMATGAPGALTPEQQAVAPEGSAARSMMDLIGQSEGTDRNGQAGYNTTYGHGRYNPGGNRDADLTAMSVNEVRDFQRGMLANQQGNSLRSSAAGRYQVMGYTLDDMVKQGVVRSDEKFDAAAQDRIAAHLMERRGLGRQQQGQITRDQLQNNLAREWASLPTTAGAGAYAGQRSSVSGQQVATALSGAPSGIGAQRQSANTGPLAGTAERRNGPASASIGQAAATAPAATIGAATSASPPPSAVPASGPAVGMAMLPPLQAPASAVPVSAGSDAPTVGHALARGEDGGSDTAMQDAAAVVGETQAEPKNANDNNLGGSDQPRAVGETPWGGGGVAPGAQAAGQGGQQGNGRQDVSGPGFTGTINAPVTVNISGVGAMDPQAVAQMARTEIERAQRRQLDQIRRGLYD